MRDALIIAAAPSLAALNLGVKAHPLSRSCGEISRKLSCARALR